MQNSCGGPATDSLPLRVRVESGKTIIRPTVGLMAHKGMLMDEVLTAALMFSDRFVKTEKEVFELVQKPMDIIVSSRSTEGTKDAVRVQSTTSLREALMYDNAIDRVVFEIMSSAVSAPSFFRIFSVRFFCAMSLGLHTFFAGRKPRELSRRVQMPLPR